MPSNMPRDRLSLGRRDGQPEIVLQRTELKRIDDAHCSVLGLASHAVYDAGRDYLVLADWGTLTRFVPDAQQLTKLEKIGLILAAKREDGRCGFRFFAPRSGLLEDHGSASVLPALVALWAGNATHGEVMQMCECPVTIAWRRRGAEVSVSAPVSEVRRGRLRPRAIRGRA